MYLSAPHTSGFRKRYNQVSHMTQDTTWESDKNTRHHHIQESQNVGPFRAGDQNATMNRYDGMTDTKHQKIKGSTKEAPPWNGQ